MSSEWYSTTLGEICKFTTGSAFKTEHQGISAGEYPFIKVSDMNLAGNEIFINHAQNFVSAEQKNAMKAKLHPIGSTVFAKIGVALQSNRRRLLVRPIIIDNNMMSATPFDEKVSSRFLYFLLSTLDFNTISAGSALPYLNVSDLQKINIEIPKDFKTQKEIEHILGALDDRITLLRETNATLEAIAQALFKSWFVDFDPVRAKMEGRAPEGMDEATAELFPDSFEETELGVVPKGWRWGTLNDLATFQNGYAFKSKDWTDAGHPVVKIGDVKPGIIDLVGCSYVAEETVAGLDRFSLSRGNLLVGMTGYVGETGLVPKVETAAYLNQRVGRLATKSGLADLGYVYCAARSPEFKEFAVAQSHGSAQANVSGTALMAFPVVIGSAPLLVQFNSVIAGILESVLTNHEEAQTLTTVRDTLLPRLISGQLNLTTH